MKVIIALAFVLVLVVIAGLLLRKLAGKRVTLGGQGQRARQPRLGVVDIFDLDKQRQLILLRRDNVEHLVMIGGPNDVVVEAAISRAQRQTTVIPVAATDPVADPVSVQAPPPTPTQTPAVVAPAPAMQQTPEPAAPAPVTPRKPEPAPPPPTQPAMTAGGSPRLATTGAVASGAAVAAAGAAAGAAVLGAAGAKASDWMKSIPAARPVDPPPAPPAAEAVPSTPAQPPGAPSVERKLPEPPALKPLEPVVAAAVPPDQAEPATKAPVIDDLDEITRQLEDALKKPFAAVKTSAPAPVSPATPLPPSPDPVMADAVPADAVADAREAATTTDIEPVTVVKSAEARSTRMMSPEPVASPATDQIVELPDFEKELAAALSGAPEILTTVDAEPERPEVAMPEPVTSDAAPPAIEAAPQPTAPAPAMATADEARPAKDDPFSVDAIEAEFARLLNRGPSPPKT